MGITTTMVPIWVAETSKAATRGALIANTAQHRYLWGLTIAYWFDYGMINNHPSTSAVWRLPIAFQSRLHPAHLGNHLLVTRKSSLSLRQRLYSRRGQHYGAHLLRSRQQFAEVAKHRSDVLSALETEKGT